MARIVQKYGGTSVGDVDRIKNVAARVAKWHDAGHQIVVVPSAMSGETNRLIGLAKEIMAQPDPRELDMIASTGEQVSVGLLAIALQSEGVPSVSYAGWQVPITTDDCYTWWSNRGQAYAKNVGWRLDYQIATPAVAQQARHAGIYKTTRFSDHAPLTIAYDLGL